MIVQAIAGATRILGAPAGHDNETAECHIGGLPIREESLHGMRWQVSAWQPTPDELVRLAAGANVELWISSPQHPVVSVGVGDIPG